MVDSSDSARIGRFKEGSQETSVYVTVRKNLRNSLLHLAKEVTNFTKQLLHGIREFVN